MLETLH